MRRLVLIAIALAAFVPSTANAAVPCRDRIYNDWYGDGKIATTYPIACYRDAIKHVHADAATYSSLLDDIRSAMQAAIQRRADKTVSVPEQVGKGGQGAVEPAVARINTKAPAKHPSSRTKSEQTQRTLPTSTVASGPTSGDGGGVPTPILILGALALVLAAVGAAGAGAKRFRRRPGA